MYSKLMRTVVYFCEETQMRNMRVPERLIKKSHEVYSKAWEHHPHGDHDETPPRTQARSDDRPAAAALQPPHPAAADRHRRPGEHRQGARAGDRRRRSRFPAAYYLASAGIGTLVLADGDTVDLTNLQRQILHRTDAVGMPKVESGKAHAGRDQSRVSR
jgi:hypothetical protein